MSFGAPSMPAPVVMPPPPTMASPLQPAGQRPVRKAMQQTVIGGDLVAQNQQSERTLIGGTPTALGA